MHLDELSGSSQSPAPTRRQTRAVRGKAAAPAELSEPPSCDSEGFESGPTYSLTSRRSGRTRSATLRAMDSDSDAMDVHSQVGTPSSTRARGTPCSSRTGSGNSSRGAPASRRSAKDCSIVVENVSESAEEGSTLNDSKLESTLIAEGADETVVEEDESQTVEDHEGVNSTELSSTKAGRKKETDFASKEDSHASPSEPVSEPAVVSKNQQEEPSAGNKDEDTLEMEVMQETVPSPERLEPCQSVTETTCERALETTEEAKETQKAVDLLPPLPDESVDDDVIVENRPSVGEEMEVSTSQQVVESIQVTSYQQHKVTAGSDSEPKDVIFVDEAGDEDEDDDNDAKVLFSSRNSHVKELSSRIDPGLKVKELGGLYISFDGSKSKPVSSSLQKLKEKKIQDEVMKKSVIGPDFEKKDAVPPYSESKHALKLKRRAEREKSTGDGWFNMKAPEITQELKGDLQVLKMRASLDPKRFYKKNDRDGFPKYFQVGTVVDNAADFYHSRIPKKERKRTIVEELLADAEFRQKNKKRYQHVMAEKAAQEAGKKNRKKKKFHKK
uniref:Fcf2 pre-rRNA processing C-terminal domain-containing protein n=1 Tax=Astatotilapia calliptera TaxID=8154 RepID=A0AAX7VQA8_ASTCA